MKGWWDEATKTERYLVVIAIWLFAVWAAFGLLKVLA